MLTAAIVLAFALLAASPASAGRYADFVIDVNSGQVLHSQDADSPRYPASLTKMMTLYVVFEMLATKRISLDTELEVSARAAAAQPSKLGLKPGARITLKNAIKALVTKSANDVAIVIAENIGGSEEKFARYMTWKARKLGMMKTRFVNASGLPNPLQTTTARDLATLSLHLVDDYPKYYRYFSLQYFSYGGRRMRNHNGLLFSYKGTDGIKTGYTRASGFNLAASVRRNGRHVIGIVLGGRSSRDRNARMRSLLTAALAKASPTRTRKRPAPAEPLVAEAKPAKPAAASKPVKVAKATTVASDAPEAEAAALAAPAEAVPAPVEIAAPTPATAATGGKRKASVASMPAPAPAEDPTEDGPPGPFHVQVGAYGTRDEAYLKLDEIGRTAPQLVKGHGAYAVEYNAPSQVWYRARFAGFPEASARKVCASLKALSFDCMVMRAE